MQDCLTLISRLNNRKGEPNVPIANLDKQWVGYAIKAMNPVKDKITEQLVLSTADFREKLNNGYASNGFNVSTVLIGGLENDLHITMNDTVDILILTDQEDENKATNNQTPEKNTLRKLRDLASLLIQNIYPEAILDDSQPLALEMSIPSRSVSYCLYFAYRQNSQATASGFNFSSDKALIYDFYNHNFQSFDHLEWKKAIEEKNNDSNGNYKVLVRLLKNAKTDSEKPIMLTGYQITSIVYSMDTLSIANSKGQLMLLLLETSLFLKRIIENPFIRQSLKNPNGQQLIGKYNESSFLEGCIQLKYEVENLIKALIMEVDLYAHVYNPPRNH